MKKILFILFFNLVFLILISKSQACDVIITSLPYTIRTKNTYYCLAENLTSTGNGIIIPHEAKDYSNNTVDCRGYALIGSGGGIGILIEGFMVTNNVIKNCIIEGFGTGVLWYGYPSNPSNNLIYNCTIVNSGVYYHFAKNNNNLINSTIIGNGYTFALIFYHGDNNIIANNTIINNAYGLRISYSYNNYFINNKWINNSMFMTPWGKVDLYIKDSFNNYFYGNFFNLGFNCVNEYGNPSSCLIVLGTNYWNTTKELGGGNYWTNPNKTGYSDTCVDNNKDGFCDSPYIINPNNLDYHPLALAYISPFCGNGICETGENYTNCCFDCGCPEGYECINNTCKPIKCMVCDYSKLNPNKIEQYLLIGVCMFLNVIVCNPILLALFFTFIIILYFYKSVKNYI